jgi:hypothetical protein
MLKLFNLIKKILQNKYNDWKGYPIIRKAYFSMMFSLLPLRTWKLHSNDVIRAMELTNIDIVQDKAIIDFLMDLKYRRCSRVLMTLREMLNLFRIVKKTENLNGDIAEVGVYRGGSAAILANFKGNRALHLFDTFEGLPEVKDGKDILVKGEMQDTSEQMVIGLLNGISNYYIYKGIFPDTAGPVKNKTFSVVHLDTDLYDATLSSLEFFYPRMEKDGVIITHDYNDILTPGVKMAFDEFFSNKIENIVEIWDTHAMVVKN